MTERETGRRDTQTPPRTSRPQNRTTELAIGIQLRSLGPILPYAPAQSTIQGQETARPSTGQGVPDAPTYADPTGKACPICKVGMTREEIDNAPDVSVSVQRMYTPTDMDGYEHEPVYYKQDYGTRTRAYARPCSTCIDELRGRQGSFVREKHVRQWLRHHE